jgi:hypothetical protein
MQIEKTSDYTMFKTITGNRTTNPTHVNRLRAIFDADPDRLSLVPILVNEKMQVVDGQHRLEAAKKAEVSVYYRVIRGLTLEDCQALNSNSKMWTPTDYARAYCQTGKKPYCKYLEFRKDFDLNHDIVMRYISLEESITLLSFKMGHLKCPSYKRSVQLAGMLLQVGEYIKHYKLRAIALAFLSMALEEDYDHEKFMINLRKVGAQYEKFTQLEEATDFLKKIYG